MWNLKLWLKIGNVTLIFFLITLLYYYKNKTDNLTSEIKVQKLEFEAKIKDIELSAAKSINDQYSRMTDTLEEQEADEKVIKTETRKVIVREREIIKHAKETNNIRDAFIGYDALWGVSTKD